MSEVSARSGVHSSSSLRSSSSLTLRPHTEKVGASRLFVHPAGQSSNPLWGDLGLTMAFVEDVKRGRLSAGALKTPMPEGAAQPLLSDGPRKQGGTVFQVDGQM